MYITSSKFNIVIILPLIFDLKNFTVCYKFVIFPNICQSNKFISQRLYTNVPKISKKWSCTSRIRFGELNLWKFRFIMDDFDRKNTYIIVFSEQYNIWIAIYRYYIHNVYIKYNPLSQKLVVFWKKKIETGWLQIEIPFLKKLHSVF